MPKVKVLNKETAEIIAAGEVIERPASIIKELVENAIDSGADNITIEIKQGGVSYIRVADNGCGISPEDVPTAFLRHATSKISEKDDLDKISTLGFRGEALASICAVAKVEVMSKTADSDYGIRYVIEGTEETALEQCGCRNGTTIIVRDIFYNVPARLKFLKKDVAEGNAIADIANKIAISHPEISFKFIRDNRQEFVTAGDNELYSSVYAVMGKQFAASMIPVDYNLNGIKIDGFTVKPLFCRPKRTFQYFFINGRYVKTFACMTALEEAYKNTIMEGKFPACVLRMTVPPNILDVNVHPAKIEVRFSDEHIIRDAVYFSVKNAILMDSKPAEIKLPERKKTVEDYTRKPFFENPPEYVQTAIKTTPIISEISNRPVNKPVVECVAVKENIIEPKSTVNEISYTEKMTDIPIKRAVDNVEKSVDDVTIDELKPVAENKEFKYISNQSFVSKNEPVAAPTEVLDLLENIPDEVQKEIFFRVIGEAFKNYIIAEIDDEIIFVDKHAAHERIIFERLKSGNQTLECQLLLRPDDIELTYEEVEALNDNRKLAEDIGFAFEITSKTSVTVCGIPTILDGCDPAYIMAETAHNICENRNNPSPEILDDIYHSIACKAAIKANDISSTKELAEIVRTLLIDETIRYCPHGRPVMFKITKRELEKNFKRIV